MTENKTAYIEHAQKRMFADVERKPVVLRKEMEKLGLLAPHMSPKDLIDETFIIFKAKPFKSKYVTEDDPYFCHCTDLEHKEVWTVVLGGQAVVEMLKQYIALETGKPIQVTLRFMEGGAHDGYYTIE